MTKLELIARISERTGVKKKEVGRVIDSFIENVIEEVGKGGEVRIIPFGIFRVVERKERRGRNPKTGEEMKIPSKKVVKFIVGKRLKEVV